MIKMLRHSSLPLDMPHLSLRRPRLRHDRRPACLSSPNLTLDLCILSFVLLLAIPHLAAPNFTNSSPTETVAVYVNCLRSHFSVCQPKSLHSRARDYLSELPQATFPEVSHSFLCSFFCSTEFLVAATNLSLSTAAGPDKAAYPMLKAPSSLWHECSSTSSIFFGLCISFLPSGRHRHYYSHLSDGKTSRLSYFLLT